MTCREFADFMIDYLSGELPSANRVRFDDHLRACQNCQRYLKAYEHSVRLGQCAFGDLDAAVPAEVPEALVQAILVARRPQG